MKERTSARALWRVAWSLTRGGVPEDILAVQLGDPELAEQAAAAHATRRRS